MTQTQCHNCVMDGSASEITFDESGTCNFCIEAQRELALLKKLNLSEMLNKIYKSGKGKEYDCLIGLSGGVDSSYALHCAVKLGLRPLCFSVDNGWNDPKADENIMRLVETLKVPFYRYTIDLKQFRSLQAAFLQAGLPNIEIPTDHILMATTYEMAQKYGIKYILSGGNVATESIMPGSWGYTARDLVHIKDVYKKTTGKTLTQHTPFFNLMTGEVKYGDKLPLCSLAKWNWYRWVKGIKIVYLLDYLDYNRNEAVAVLAKTYGYREYGDKHCESTFTAWFQNYYLFEKFGFDKRKAHLSSMINSGQMTRQEALEALGKDRYFTPIGMEHRITHYKKRSHDEFKKDHYDTIAKFVRLWK